MKKEQGKKESKIWLLGDSNPGNWANQLDTPLDPRHPTRHNIWTSILNNIQKELYQKTGRLIDEDKLYYRNAVEDPVNRPHFYKSKDLENYRRPDGWNPTTVNYCKGFTQSLNYHKPLIIFTFGAFSYEFAFRAKDGETEGERHSRWGAAELGEEFKKAIDNFSLEDTNIIPLLHATIARGKFLESHAYFCNGTENVALEKSKDNYFEYTAKSISRLIVENLKKFEDVLLSEYKRDN